MVLRRTSCAQGWSRPLSCSGTVQTTTVLGDCPDHYHTRGLSRPLPYSGTAQTTTVLGDCSDHYRAWGLLRPLPCSGTAHTTTVIRDCSDHQCARELSRPLLRDRSPRLHVICTHIQLRDIYLDLATRLILRLPASSGTTSVRCNYRCILYCMYDDWILNETGNSC